ncbi:MAG: putative metalloprotease CJM1_0395 family protein [Methyloligellaceae bacterium]
MIGGVGSAAQFSYISAKAGPERTSQPSPPGTINPHTDEAAASGGGAASSSARVQPADASEKPAEKSLEKPSDPSKGKKASGEPLSEEEQQQVQKLKDTDAKVRAHENAHAAAGGPYASAPKFEFTTGPDGKRYATSGEVQIDSSPEDDPEATIRKMDVVIRAALAPADPSPQDLAVAREAQSQRAKAQLELSRKREAERQQSKGEDDGPGSVQARDSSAPPDRRVQDALAAYQQAAGADKAAGIFALIQSA